MRPVLQHVVGPGETSIEVRSLNPLSCGQCFSTQIAVGGLHALVSIRCHAASASAHREGRGGQAHVSIRCHAASASALTPARALRASDFSVPRRRQRGCETLHLFSVPADSMRFPFRHKTFTPIAARICRQMADSAPAQAQHDPPYPASAELPRPFRECRANRTSPRITRPGPSGRPGQSTPCGRSPTPGSPAPGLTRGLAQRRAIRCHAASASARWAAATSRRHSRLNPLSCGQCFSTLRRIRGGRP